MLTKKIIFLAMILFFLIIYVGKKRMEEICGQCNNPLEMFDTSRKISKRRVVNEVITNYNEDIKRKFQQAIDLKLEPSDPKLLSLVLEMMDAPSKHTFKVSRPTSHTPQSKFIYSILNKPRGFFIECGANDGETASNTIFLERSKQWTGLLIEPDPHFYTQILGKHRNTWSINACLSSTKYPQWLTFAEEAGQRGMIIDHLAKKPNFVHDEIHVPCLPLEAMLLAINVTHVDYFSLDIEGFEERFLKSLEKGKFDIETWTIEYDKIGKKKLNNIMNNLGYQLMKQLDYTEPNIHLYVHDLVFVKMK